MSSQVEEGYLSSLPSADHGRQAYLVLLGCSLLQLPVWGFAISYGVFQEYYTSSASLDGDLSSTGIIGTTLTGIIYISMPFLFGLFTNKYSHLRRHSALIGTLISASSLLLSSWATNVWQLIITQGVMQAVGSTLLYSSTTIYVDEWFIQRKGFAFGVMLSVKSAVGAGTPLLFGIMLSKLGFRDTLRIWSGIILLTAIPSIFLLRLRIGRTNPVRRGRSLSWKFLQHPTFYIFQITNIIFSASYSLPQTYLSTFATSILKLSTSRSALLLAALNAPSIIASFWFGLLSDGTAIYRERPLSIGSVSGLSAIGSCITVLLIWGLVPGQSTVGIALLALFSITYGFFAGGYSAIWGGIVKEVQKEGDSFNEAVDTGLVFGLLNGGRGIGYIIGGFAGVELLKDGAIDTNNLAYGTKFGSIILFTGIAAAFGGSGMFWRVKV